MALKDKTGPEGKGPMTGRGLGVCNPVDPKIFKGFGVMNDVSNLNRERGTSIGIGRGRGMGLGRGMNRGRSNLGS